MNDLNFIEVEEPNIAALHSSRQVNGKKAKDFDVYGDHFGWQVLKDLWKREMNRARCGRMRRVPQLCYRHIFRDCWTRLNVKPAKIMQVINAVMTLKLQTLDLNFFVQFS